MELRVPSYWTVLVLTVTCMVQSSSTAGYRLPDTIEPVHYMIDIITHLEHPNFFFEGKEWIKIRCLKMTDSIILHSKNLTIKHDDVTVKEILNEQEVQKLHVVNQKLVPENEFFIIKLNRTLLPGKQYIVHIPFKGKLTEGLHGFYRSKYFDSTSNTTKWLAVTQFESTDAREAFPCFDEPAMKASFSINLGHKKIFSAVSNMPLKRIVPMTDLKGWVWSQFEDTVPMSTYLVAFLVSEFQYKTSPQSANNVTFKIWARKDAIDQVEEAKIAGPKVLEYFENYFDVKYPLPKQDMVAIPDFSAGAMENWGLITYRESSLLYDKNASSRVHLHTVMSVVAHELAHQWFGNLVTMKWWTDLWLNEGFATYVASLGVNYLYPEWNSFDATTLDHTQLVFTLDALKSSHPVSVPIGNPTEIGQIFDVISYKKGAALLRMMNMFLGEQVFKTGVSNYLKKHMFRNAEQDDLWASLTEAAHKAGVLSKDITVKEIMDTWTIKTGYPVVTVVRDYSAGTATITQKRFLQIKPVEVEDKAKELCWWIPLSYTTLSKADFKEDIPQLWLNCKENKSVQITGLPDKSEWVIFNIRGAGLYRVQYDDENWNLLSKTLNSKNFKTIGTMNRAHILMNVLDFAWNKDLDYNTAMGIVGYLVHEDEFLPWVTGLTNLNDIDRMLRRTPTYGAFMSFVRRLIAPMMKKYNDLTAVPTKFEDVKHHNLIMKTACRYADKACIAQVKELAYKWKSMEDPDTMNPIPKDVRNLVYCNMVRTGGEDAWDFLWNRYLKSNVGTEKNTILISLGCSNDIWLLNRYLEWSINKKSGIRKQDSTTVFSAVARQDVGFYVARDFLKRRLKDLYLYYGPQSGRLGRYLSVIGDHIITGEEYQELKSLIEENQSLLTYSSLASKQALETAEANIKWHTEHYETMSQILMF